MNNPILQAIQSAAQVGAAAPEYMAKQYGNRENQAYQGLRSLMAQPVPEPPAMPMRPRQQAPRLNRQEGMIGGVLSILAGLADRDPRSAQKVLAPIMQMAQMRAQEQNQAQEQDYLMQAAEAQRQAQMDAVQRNQQLKLAEMDLERAGAERSDFQKLREFGVNTQLERDKQEGLNTRNAATLSSREQIARYAALSKFLQSGNPSLREKAAAEAEMQRLFTTMDPATIEAIGGLTPKEALDEARKKDLDALRPWKIKGAEERVNLDAARTWLTKQKIGESIAKVLRDGEKLEMARRKFNDTLSAAKDKVARGERVSGVTAYQAMRMAESLAKVARDYRVAATKKDLDAAQQQALLDQADAAERKAAATQAIADRLMNLGNNPGNEPVMVGSGPWNDGYKSFTKTGPIGGAPRRRSKSD